MPTTYPSSELPCPQVADLVPAERRAFTDPAGLFLRRPVERDFRAIQSLQWTLTSEQAQRWQTWWRTELSQGGKWFVAPWPMPDGSTTGVRRFLGPPQWTSYIAGVGWVVAAQVEVRGVGVAPSEMAPPEEELYLFILDEFGKGGRYPAGQDISYGYNLDESAYSTSWRDPAPTGEGPWLSGTGYATPVPKEPITFQPDYVNSTLTIPSFGDYIVPLTYPWRLEFDIEGPVARVPNALETSFTMGGYAPVDTNSLLLQFNNDPSGSGGFSGSLAINGGIAWQLPDSSVYIRRQRWVIKVDSPTSTQISLNGSPFTEVPPECRMTAAVSIVQFLIGRGGANWPDLSNSGKMHRVAIYGTYFS